MSDGLVLQSSAVWLCSCLSATVKNKKAFDFSSSSITHLASYALFLLPAAHHSGWHQYNWGGGCSGLNLCTLPSLPSPQMHPARGFIVIAKCFSHYKPRSIIPMCCLQTFHDLLLLADSLKKNAVWKGRHSLFCPTKPNKPARVFNVTKSHIYVLKAF